MYRNRVLPIKLFVVTFTYNRLHSTTWVSNLFCSGATLGEIYSQVSQTALLKPWSAFLEPGVYALTSSDRLVFSSSSMVNLRQIKLRISQWILHRFFSNKYQRASLLILIRFNWVWNFWWKLRHNALKGYPTTHPVCVPWEPDTPIVVVPVSIGVNYDSTPKVIANDSVFPDSRDDIFMLFIQTCEWLRRTCIDEKIHLL